MRNTSETRTQTTTESEEVSEAMVTYHVGDAVWVRMGVMREVTYPGTVTAVLGYSEQHSDGSECWQYEVEVQFPHETVTGLVSECMMSERREVKD